MRARDRGRWLPGPATLRLESNRILRGASDSAVAGQEVLGGSPVRHPASVRPRETVKVGEPAGGPASGALTPDDRGPLLLVVQPRLPFPTSSVRRPVVRSGPAAS